MNAPKWWWVGCILDLLLLPPAIYMAVEAADVARQNSDSVFAVVVAVLFFALPVFCIAAPLAARRTRMRDRRTFHVTTLFAAPWIYAAFLVFFLLNG